MIIERISYLLHSNGYQIMNTNISLVKFFVKRNMDSDSNNINIIGCINNSLKEKITVEQLDNIAFQVERKYLLTGMQKVNMIYFIYSDNIERDKVFSNGKTDFWLIDTLAEQVIVYENQPEEFDDIRRQIEELFRFRKREGITDERWMGDRKKKRNVKNRRGGIKKEFPIITFVIILINVIVHFSLEYLGSTQDVIFMLNHGAAFQINIFEMHEYYRLFTCMFLHFGFAHLLNNMLSLWLLGGEVERFYGKIKFTIIYFVSGIAGSFLSSICYYLLNENVVSAGASGAIYGIMGALVVKIIEERKKKGTSFGKVAAVFLLLMMFGRNGENIDNIAHIGGFVAGMISGIICCVVEKNRSLYRYF